MLKRIQQFIARTGEHCVVFSGEGDPLVVMSLTEYEALKDIMADSIAGEQVGQEDFSPETEKTWNESVREGVSVAEEPWYIEPIEGQ